MPTAAPVLHIESEGSGPSVVLAHGFGGSARNFRPQARALRDTFRVLTYDARGHARSEAPLDRAAYSLEQLVDDYGRVVATSGDRKVVAGGLSLGAATALGYALREPERVRGLLLASYPSYREKKAWAQGFADAIRERGLEAAGAEFARPALALHSKGAELIRQGFMEHPPHALEAILRNVLGELSSPDELEPRLRTLDVPALIVAGEDDTEGRGPSERLAALLPRAELVVVPHAGHVVNLAKPSEFNARARAFLDALG